jgi:hypothetical protein
MINNSNNFTTSDEVEMYNNALSFCEEKLIELEKLKSHFKNNTWHHDYRYNNKNHVTADIITINNLHKTDFYITDIKAIKNFILNSKIVFVEPKITSKNDLTINLKYRLKFPKNNSGFADLQKMTLKFTEDKHNNNVATPTIESNYGEFFIKYKKLVNENNQYNYNYFRLIDDLITNTLLKDPEIIEKTKEFNSSISSTYAEKQKSKHELVKAFFNKRFENVSAKMKEGLKDSPLIATVSTDELVKVFQVISKFPEEINCIRNITKYYDNDIIHMNEDDIKNIFDEIKVLALFK